MRDQLLAFYGNDPVVSWLLTGALCVLIGSAAVALNSLLERRQRRKDATRRELLERIVKASAGREIRYPPASGKKGFDAQHRRRA